MPWQRWRGGREQARHASRLDAAHEVPKTQERSPSLYTPLVCTAQGAAAMACARACWPRRKRRQPAHRGHTPTTLRQALSKRACSRGPAPAARAGAKVTGHRGGMKQSLTLLDSPKLAVPPPYSTGAELMGHQHHGGEVEGSGGGCRRMGAGGAQGPSPCAAAARGPVRFLGARGLVWITWYQGPGGTKGVFCRQRQPPHPGGRKDSDADIIRGVPLKRAAPCARRRSLGAGQSAGSEPFGGWLALAT